MDALFRRRSALALTVAGALLPRPAASQASFARWVDELGREAARRGVRTATVDRAFAGVSPVSRVLELDRRQPERRLTFGEYRAGVVSRARIERGRASLTAHHELLRRTELRYGVPARVLVALWGLESNFGDRLGGFPVIDSLATLAFDGRRARFFRGELLSALEILDRGEVPLAAFRGSWAGAMGQCQFMPSTYLGYAVDADRDGRRDIWGSLPDVFGSTANYLARSGWREGVHWGRAVSAAEALSEGGLDRRLPMARWRDLGVRLADGGELPGRALEASLVRPDGSDESFLVYDNFRTLMVWNRSTYFALSVGILSDQLEDS